LTVQPIGWAHSASLECAAICCNCKPDGQFYLIEILMVIIFCRISFKISPVKLSYKFNFVNTFIALRVLDIHYVKSNSSLCDTVK